MSDENTQGSVTPNGSACRSLQTLPYEIRLEIYKYLLLEPSSSGTATEDDKNLLNHSHKPYYVHGQPSPGSSNGSGRGGSSSNSKHPPQRIHGAILSTCRQLHAETLPFLYGRNQFVAHHSMLTSFPRLREWYGPVRPDRLSAMITRFRIRVRLDAGVQYDAGKVAAHFSGKQELVVDVWQAAWRAAGPANLWLFEDVRGVARARVTGSTGGFEDYAAWLEGVMMSPVGSSVLPYTGKALE